MASVEERQSPLSLMDSSPDQGKSYGNESSYDTLQGMAAGMGRRMMRQIIAEHQSQAANSNANDSQPTSAPRRRKSSLLSRDIVKTTPNDHEKINFVRMILAMKMTKTDGECCEVMQTNGAVFIGSIGAAYNLETLQRNGITHVLCLCEGVRDKFLNHNIKYLHVCCEDNPSFDIALKFIECCDFVDSVLKSNGKILIHCFKGQSRASTIAMAYLMLRRGLSFDSALECCRKNRPVVQPNLGFIAQLKALDRSLKSSKVGRRTGSISWPTADASTPTPTPTPESNLSPPKPPSPPKMPPPPRPSAPPGAQISHDKFNVNVDEHDGPQNYESSNLLVGDDKFHIAAAASVVIPKTDENIQVKFQRSASFTVKQELNEASHYADGETSITIQVKSPAKSPRENEVIATRACNRLYRNALRKKKKLESEVFNALDAETYTFAPKVNGSRNGEKAILAHSQGRVGYMEETIAVKRQFDKNALKAQRMEEQRKNGVSPRFQGFGSMWHDLEVGSDRELGRTSPTIEEPSFAPTLSKYNGNSRIKSNIMAPTFSSTVASRVAQKKKEMVDSGRSNHSRYNGPGPGFVIGIDECEAEVIYQEKKRKQDVEEAARKNNSGEGSKRTFTSGDFNEGATKDTLCSYLKAKNQTHKRLEISKSSHPNGNWSNSDRFNSPGSLYYNVVNNANSEVNEWTTGDDDDATSYRRVLTTEEEKELNAAHFDKLYLDGVEHLIAREVNQLNAPLSEECTFAPRLETREEGASEVSETRTNSKKEKSETIKVKVKTIRKTKANTTEKTSPLVVDKFPSKSNRSVKINQSLETKLRNSQNEKLVGIVKNLTRRESDLARIEGALVEEGDDSSNPTSTPAMEADTSVEIF